MRILRKTQKQLEQSNVDAVDVDREDVYTVDVETVDVDTKDVDYSLIIKKRSVQLKHAEKEHPISPVILVKNHF